MIFNDKLKANTRTAQPLSLWVAGDSGFTDVVAGSNLNIQGTDVKLDYNQFGRCSIQTGIYAGGYTGYYNTAGNATNQRFNGLSALTVIGVVTLVRNNGGEGCVLRVEDSTANAAFSLSINPGSNNIAMLIGTNFNQQWGGQVAVTMPAGAWQLNVPYVVMGRWITGTAAEISMELLGSPPIWRTAGVATGGTISGVSGAYPTNASTFIGSGAYSGIHAFPGFINTVACLPYKITDGAARIIGLNPASLFQPARKNNVYYLPTGGDNNVSGTFTNSLSTISGTVTTINSVSATVTNSLSTISGSVTSKNTISSAVSNTLGTVTSTVTTINPVSIAVTNSLSSVTSTVTTINTVSGSATNSLSTVSGTVTSKNTVSASVSNTLSTLTGSITTTNIINIAVSNVQGTLAGNIVGAASVSGNITNTLGTLSGTVTTINPVSVAVTNSVSTVTASVTSKNTVTGTFTNTLGTISGSVIGSASVSGNVTNTLGTVSTTVTTINIAVGTISNSQSTVTSTVTTRNIVAGSIVSQQGVFQGLINTINVVSGSVSGNPNIFTYTPPIVIPMNQFRKFTTIQLHGIEITKVLIKPI